MTNSTSNFDRPLGLGYKSPEGEDEEVSVDLKRILGALRKYFWVVLLFLLAGGIAAAAYLTFATPIYESSAILEVEQRVQNAAPTMRDVATAVEDLRTVEMIGTIQRAFLSRTLMEQVTRKLDLVKREAFLANVPVDQRTEAECVQYLLKNTRTEMLKGTRLIEIAFEHPDPAIATEITEALIREFMAIDSEQRLKSSGHNVGYLKAEKQQLEKQLRDSREKLAKYTAELGSVSVGSGLNIIAEQLQQLNGRLTLATGDRLKLESDFEQVEMHRNDPEALLSISSVASLPEIQALKVQLNELDSQIGAQKQRYGTENPVIRQLLSQRATLVDSLHAEALRAPRTLEISLRAAIQNEASLEREVKAQEARTISIQEKAIEATVLEGQIAADQISYQAVLERLNAEWTLARSSPIFLQVIDEASAAYKVAPKIVVVIAIAAVASLLLAAGVIFLLAVLDSTIKSVDEAEKYLDLPVLSVVPEMPLAPKVQESTEVRKAKKQAKDGQRGRLEPVRIALIEDRHSTVSEAFRTLRSAVALLPCTTSRMMFTSAMPGEGKSFCSVNVAVAFAQQEGSVLLIDADLRKPSLEGRLYGTSRHVGLADFLSGRATFDEIIRESHVPHLYVVTAGKRYSNPAELLARRERVEEFLAMAEERYERVIVDSAPVLAVSDSLSLAAHFETISVVLRSHKTNRKFVQRTVDLLARGGHPAKGVVLNMVPAKGGAEFYSYSGYYGKTYGQHVDLHEGATA